MKRLSQQLIESTYAAPMLALLASMLSIWLPIGWITLIFITWFTLACGAQRGLSILAWYALPAITLSITRHSKVYVDLSLIQAVALWLAASLYLKKPKLENALRVFFIFSLVGLTIFYILLPDVAAFWQKILTSSPMLQNFNNNPELKQQVLPLMSQMATPILLISTSLFTSIYFIVAGWWLNNTTGRNSISKNLSWLRLETIDFLVIPAACLIAYFMQQQLQWPHFLRATALICAMPLALTGLSIAHHRLAKFSWRHWLLAAIYIGLAIIPAIFGSALIILSITNYIYSKFLAPNDAAPTQPSSSHL